jgi:hypothetical protein
MPVRAEEKSSWIKTISFSQDASSHPFPGSSFFMIKETVHSGNVLSCISPAPGYNENGTGDE